MNAVKNNNTVSIVVISLMAVAALFLVLSLLFGINMSTNYNGAMMGIGTGISATSVLLLLVKLLLVVFVAGLGIGVFFEGKKLYEKQKQVTKDVTEEETVSPQPVVNAHVYCTCGKEQSPEWKLCPFCGAEKPVIEKEEEIKNV